MRISSFPVKFSVLIMVIVLLIQVSQNDARKLSEKSKLAKEKAKQEQRCPDSKDGTCKSTRQGLSANDHSEKPNTQVGHYSPFKSRFTNYFINALHMAERIVLDFSREILSQYGGWDRNGWEMNVLEMVVKTLSKDLILILQALQ